MAETALSDRDLQRPPDGAHRRCRGRARLELLIGMGMEESRGRHEHGWSCA